jgi:flagellar protein FliO/FliZ
MGSEYTHVFLNLFAVIALMGLLFFLMKKFKLAKYASNKHIKIINIVPIGTKEKVILMEVNNTMLLLGATPNHIETLYVFNELMPTEESVEEKKDFAALMSHS